jgi:Flp pilus assembly protein TadD
MIASAAALHPSRTRSSCRTRLAQAALLSLLVVSLTGCASTKRDAITTGSIPTRVSTASLDTMTATQLAEAERSLGASYVRDPRNRDIGLRYARILSMTGKGSQALAVMQQVAIARHAENSGVAQADIPVARIPNIAGAQ